MRRLPPGFGVNAGHDLTVANLPALVKRIPALAEVSIGHGLTADALEYGMAGNGPALPQGLRLVGCEAVSVCAPCAAITLRHLILRRSRRRAPPRLSECR